MTYSYLPLPPRMLAVINAHVDLKGTLQNTPMKSNQSLLMDQYPNMVIIPVINTTPKQTDTVVPFVVINLSSKSIFHYKC